MAQRSNKRLGLILAGVVPVMLGLSYAAVPAYSWFCAVTGFGGTPLVAEAASGEVLDQTITVRFDSNIEPGMGWEFRPVQRSMDIRLGETGLAFFEAWNPTDQRLAGQASYNIAPYAAGGYFTKIACFCFDLQVLEPGERVEMPVVFFVDPEIIEDAEARHATNITLSYTMHPADLPEAELAAAASAASADAGTIKN
jgi:cytochrome c oxidase assembly protein subunit 11